MIVVVGGGEKEKWKIYKIYNEFFFVIFSFFVISIYKIICIQLELKEEKKRNKNVYDNWEYIYIVE